MKIKKEKFFKKDYYYYMLSDQDDVEVLNNAERVKRLGEELIRRELERRRREREKQPEPIHNGKETNT